MIVWMTRVARHLKKEIELKVQAYAEKRPVARRGRWGNIFCFLMVLREGTELAMILRAWWSFQEG